MLFGNPAPPATTGETQGDPPHPAALQLERLPYLGSYLRSGGVDRYLAAELERGGSQGWWVEELTFVLLTAAVPVVSFSLGFDHAVTLATKAAVTALLALASVVFFAAKRRRRQQLCDEHGRLPRAYREAAVGRVYRGFAVSYALFMLVMIPAMWVALLHPQAAYGVDLCVGLCSLAELYLLARQRHHARLPARLHRDVLAIEAMGELYTGALRRFDFMCRSETERGLSFVNKAPLREALSSFEQKIVRAAMLVDHQMEKQLTFADDRPTTFAQNLAALDAQPAVTDELLESMLAEMRLLAEAEAAEPQL